jgi:hypothetical protein
MPSVASPCAPVNANRKRLPPVPVTGSFVGGPSMNDLVHGVAVLEVLRPEDSDYYWCSCCVDQGRLLGFYLTKFGAGQTYFVDAECKSCDCGDAVYRERQCKHARALRQALESLGRRPS